MSYSYSEPFILFLQQLARSTDVMANQGVDTNLLAVNPSPSITPWGSRSASPYPSLVANESAEEALTGADMEVLHVTTGFRPIPSVQANFGTPGDSPTEGILPVGGVVKGHSFPGEKSEALVRMKLQKDYTASQESGSLKAFVVIEPNNEKLSDPKYEAERAAVNVTGAKEPSGVKVDSAKEPPGVKMDGGREPPGVKTDAAKEPSGLKGDPVGGNKEEIKTASVADNRGSKTSSWYVIEGANQDSGSEGSAEGKRRTSQGHSSISADMESEGSEKVDLTGVVKTKPFAPGHRRVASSPPSITVSSFDNKPLSGGGNTCGVAYLDRSRSDSDLSAHAKQTLDESRVSKDVSSSLVEVMAIAIAEKGSWFELVKA